MSFFLSLSPDRTSPSIHTALSSRVVGRLRAVDRPTIVKTRKVPSRSTFIYCLVVPRSLSSPFLILPTFPQKRAVEREEDNSQEPSQLLLTFQCCPWALTYSTGRGRAVILMMLPTGSHSYLLASLVVNIIGIWLGQCERLSGTWPSLTS